MEIRILKHDSAGIMGLLMAISQQFPEHTNDLLQLTRSVKDGLSVEIRPIKINHSRDQENYYRKWCREFGIFTGDTPDEMHAHIMRETFGTVMVTTGTGMKVRANRETSSSLSVEEYAELIETLIRVAANFGFVVPPPIRNQHDNTQ